MWVHASRFVIAEGPLYGGLRCMNRFHRSIMDFPQRPVAFGILRTSPKPIPLSTAFLMQVRGHRHMAGSASKNDALTKSRSPKERMNWEIAVSYTHLTLPTKA